MGNRKGFTILELGVTIAILSIVALIAAPAFHRYGINTNLKTAVRDMASDVELLRGRAIAENRMQRITIDAPGNRYALQQCNGPGSPCAAWEVIQDKTLLGFASDLRFEAGAITATEYVFQPRGTVTSGRIVVRNSRGSIGTLTLTVTGRQNVQFIFQ